MIPEFDRSLTLARSPSFVLVAAPDQHGVDHMDHRRWSASVSRRRVPWRRVFDRMTVCHHRGDRQRSAPARKAVMDLRSINIRGHPALPDTTWKSRMPASAADPASEYELSAFSSAKRVASESAVGSDTIGRPSPRSKIVSDQQRTAATKIEPKAAPAAMAVLTVIMVMASSAMRNRPSQRQRAAG